MTTIIGSVTLDNDMVWVDEFKYKSLDSEETLTTGGGWIVQEFIRSGRPVTLQSIDGQGYQKKTTVAALKALANVLHATYSLSISHNSKTFTATVRFINSGEEGGVDFDMAAPLDGLRTDGAWYGGTIFMRTI